MRLLVVVRITVAVEVLPSQLVDVFRGAVGRQRRLPADREIPVRVLGVRNRYRGGGRLSKVSFLLSTLERVDEHRLPAVVVDPDRRVVDRLVGIQRRYVSERLLLEEVPIRLRNRPAVRVEGIGHVPLVRAIRY